MGTYDVSRQAPDLEKHLVHVHIRHAPRGWRRLLYSVYPGSLQFN